MTSFEIVVVAALGINAALLLFLLFRRLGSGEVGALHGRLEGLEKALERVERATRDESGAGRDRASAESAALRSEVAGAVSTLEGGLHQALNTHRADQQTRLDQVGASLDKVVETNVASATQLRVEVNQRLSEVATWIHKTLNTYAGLQKQQVDAVSAQVSTAVTQIGSLASANEQRFEHLRMTVETKLGEIRSDNALRLEQIRRTVDEQLQGVLERRLGESFQLVSRQLDQVHKGLGEMQSLATGVGDLKKVLTNVKVRGTWGEMQLGSILEQVLSPEQYEANVATRPDGAERVEFAVKLPGRSEVDGEVVWLPIDSKFPLDDYQRLLDAQERSDPLAAEDAGRKLEAALRKSAADIAGKYLSVPATTDFGILFLPTEGLYAEVLRRPGLADAVQREHRIIISGPTTLAALLSSLRMGFRTLAIQRRSSEVWQVLGAVKTEFESFSKLLDKVHKKLQEASNVVSDANRRRSAVVRKLQDVQQMPAADASLLLGHGLSTIDAAEELVETEDEPQSPI